MNLVNLLGVTEAALAATLKIGAACVVGDPRLVPVEGDLAAVVVGGNVEWPYLKVKHAPLAVAVSVM